MSISGSQLVQDALFACGAYGVGDNLDNGDAQLVLRRLNRMLESWDTEKLSLWESAVESLTMSSGVTSYLTTSLPSTIRPTFVDSWYVRLDGTDYHGDFISMQEYDDIPQKTVQGIPRMCYVRARLGSQQLNFYPTPDAAYTLFVSVRRKFGDVAGTQEDGTRVTLSTTLTLPPGYERAIVDNLAVDISPSFGRPPNPILMQQAVESKRTLKRLNHEPIVLDSNLARSRGSILTDGL